MSAPLAVEVIPGYEFPTDGSVPLTYELLNLLGKPTVNLTGALGSLTLADNAVTTGKIADGAVTLAKLATGLFTALGWPVGAVSWFPKALEDAASGTLDETVVEPADGTGAVYVLLDGSRCLQASYPALFDYLGHDWDEASDKGGAITEGTQFRLPVGDVFLYGSDDTITPGSTGGGTADITHTHVVQNNPVGVTSGGATNVVGRNAVTDAPSVTSVAVWPKYAAGQFYMLAGYKVGGVWI